MILFRCPCGSQLPIALPDEMAGVSTPCPHSGMTITVPRQPFAEADWLACSDPAILRLSYQGNLSERKSRLFACACLRRLYHLLRKDDRQALNVCERSADGLASLEELALARKDADLTRRRFTPGTSRALDAVLGVAGLVAATNAEEAFNAAAGAGLAVAEWIARWAAEAEHRSQCDLAREVFGNPFRPVAVRPEWLAWNGGTVPGVARAIYDERRFEDLPVLADALEDAGCDDAHLLEHCRAQAAHVRGCWALDALLDRS